MKKIILASVLAVAVLSPNTVCASMLTVVVEGVATSVDSQLLGEFSVSESMRLSYAFDTTTADSYSADDTRGLYLGSIQSASFKIGDYSVMITGAGNIFTRDGAFSEDLYAVEMGEWPFLDTRPTANLLGNTVGGRFPYYAGFGLHDLDETVFFSDAMPIAWPNLSLFESNEIELAFADELGSGVAFDVQRVQGIITSIQVVPVPGAIWLFCSAMGLLGWRRRL